MHGAAIARVTARICFWSTVWPSALYESGTPPVLEMLLEMLLKTTPVFVALFTMLSATAVRAEGTMSAAPSTPAGKNMIWNGAFDGASLRPWSAMVDSGKCADTPTAHGNDLRPRDARVWDPRPGRAVAGARRIVSA